MDQGLGSLGKPFLSISGLIVGNALHRVLFNFYWWRSHHKNCQNYPAFSHYLCIHCVWLGYPKLSDMRCITQNIDAGSYHMPFTVQTKCMCTELVIHHSLLSEVSSVTRSNHGWIVDNLATGNVFFPKFNTVGHLLIASFNKCKIANWSKLCI